MLDALTYFYIQLCCNKREIFRANCPKAFGHYTVAEELGKVLSQKARRCFINKNPFLLCAY